MTLRPGDMLLHGQYRIKHLLERRGFGFVYLAEDTRLRQDRLIKELVPALEGSEKMLNRFFAEAQATMELTHENIVRTYNVFREEDHGYIVTEYMAGGSLEERLQASGFLPVSTALRWADEVCQGLAYVHRQGIVHCALHPGNILLTTEGLAKVADCGLARVLGEMRSDSRHTPAGFTVKDLPYVSPEQTDGARQDPRMDVYALGAVLYRMLTGRTYLQFDQRESPQAQADNIQAIHTQQPAPPSSHNPQVPAWLDAVVLKALAKRPGRRYETASVLRAALLTGARATADQRPVQSKRLPLPAWFWPAVGVAALLLVAIVALFLLFGGGRGGGPLFAPSPTLTRAATPTIMPSPEPTAMPSPEPTITPSPEPTATPSPEPTATLPPEPTATRPPEPTATPSPEPPPAQLGSEANPIVMAFMPTGDTDRIRASGQRLVEMLASRTGLVVEAYTGADDAAVREAMGEGRAHAGWLDAFSYILANERYGVDVALVAERFGVTYYRGQLIVRADSGITTLEDLKGTVICWVGPSATSGYLVPAVMLAANGIDPDADFAGTIEAGSHENVVTAVYNGDCDVGATYADARDPLVADLPDVKEQVVVLARTTGVPNHSLSFFQGVPPALRGQIVDALLEIAQIAEGQVVLQDLYAIAGLQRTDDSIYDGFRTDLDQAGIDIEELVR